MWKHANTLLFPLLLLAGETPEPPDSFTPRGHCVVSTPQQRSLGMLRFKTPKEALELCKGVMIFTYPDASCKTFHMEGMQFPIWIEANGQRHFFAIGEHRTLCSKIITERIITR